MHDELYDIFMALIPQMKWIALMYVAHTAYKSGSGHKLFELIDKFIS